MLDTRTDEEVVKEVQNGDTESFGILVERYEGKLERYARRFLFGKEDTVDLLQDVFLHAYAHIQSVDTTRKFSSWVYRIAHNIFVNALRKKERYKTGLIDFDTILPTLTTGDRADESAMQKEERVLLERVLKDVDPKYREPLILFYYEELSYEEIADVLGIPIPTVGVRLKRGREMAKKLISTTHPTFTSREEN